MPEAPANAHRNLALTTSSSWSTPYTYFNGRANIVLNVSKVITDGMRVGDTFRARVVIKYDNVVPAEGKTAKIWMQGPGNVTDWNAGGFPNTAGQKVLNGSGEIVFESTETLKAEHLKNDWWQWQLRIDYVASGSVKWKEGKVEIGKNFTPYTPAPEQLGWSTATLVPTQQQRYLWKFEYVYYSDGSVEVTKPVNLSIAGADADTSGVTDAINKNNQAVAEAKQQLATVSSDLSKAKTDLQNAVSVVDTKATNLQSDLSKAKQQLATVSSDLSKAKTDLHNAVSAVDTKATNLQSDLTKAKQDLTNQASQLTAQANAQSELTKRVSSVEETTNGTKMTVSELSKTVAQNGKDITSVTNRTKTVEDDLAGTKTTLSQVKTTADSTSQKTATLETGLNGLNAKFDNLRVGGRNYVTNLASNWQNKYVFINGASTGSFLQQNSTTRISPKEFIAVKAGEQYTISLKELTDADYYFKVTMSTVNAYGKPNSMLNADEWIRTETYTFTAPEDCNYIMISVGCDTGVTPEDLNTKFNIKLEKGNIATDYSPNDADLEQKVAEYKQNADQNYASLSSTVQTLDGQVQSNKTTAEQTAQGFKTRIESLETYKSGESTRANQYFESAKTETARQLTVERTAIAKDYVAKSTYTSDITGIRNELSATTTTANTIKTNLANYQASNDKMVASLKSSLQTTDGNVNNLQTKVEAVPGQITSAVSAVEGKIPTEIGGCNLYALSKEIGRLGAKGGATNLALDVANGTLSFDVNGAHPYFGECVWAGINYAQSYGQLIPVKANSAIAVSFTSADFNENYVSFVTKNKGAKGPKVFRTQKVVLEASELDGVEYIVVRGGVNNSDGPLTGETVSTKVKIEYGSVYTDWSPAPEDTANQINTLSSQIQQTADGMTLLATKTELNTAKNELQSGISTATSKADNAQATANNNAQTLSTHTTQISALNTGMQAKVSQSDFNTLSGRVTTAENNITAKANELSSKITSVEGKIPTSVGSRNYIKDSEYRKANIYVNDNQSQDEAFNISPAFWQNSNVYNKKIKLSFYYQPSVAYETERKFPVYFRESPWPRIGEVTYPANTTRLIKYTIAMSNGLPTNFTAPQIFIRFTGNLDKGRYHNIGKVMLEVSDVFSDWSPAPEDTIEQISSLSSELKQTKDGISLLATKTELNTAKNELHSGITTATSKADNAQSTANNNAQTISTHTTQISALNTGLQAKVSQSEFNTLSGRVTTAENNIIAKANELSSKITSVEGKIPTSVGGTNYLTNISSNWQNKYVFINGASTGSFLQQNSTTRISPKKFIAVEAGKQYTVSLKELTNVDYYFKVTMSTVAAYGKPNSMLNKDEWIYSDTYTFTAPEDCNYIMISVGCDAGVTPEDLNTKFNIKVERGNIATDYSPSPEDYDSKLATAQSEIKQTTDAIKASVTSLDNSTVKSSSLTINADGIVMKAGKSTTDVANAIGSYFAVNQNAINLFADKIKVKGNMIVDGAITGDKIKANSVDVTKIVGIDADFIKSKIEYAMIDWLKGKTITAYNDNMTIDLQNGRISFKDGSNAVYRQTPDGIHTGFLHFEAGSQGGIYAAFGATSTRQGINSKSSEFAGIRCYRVSKDGDSHDAKIDKIEVIGDTVQFGHGYRSDGSIGGGFIIDTAAYANETPYSLNRVIKSIEALWRILHDHAKNTGYRFNDSAFINALNNEYNAWHDMHND